MKQEQKDLLFKELCTRLPYGVKVSAPFTSDKNENAKGYKINGINFGVVEWTPTLFGEKKQRNSIIIEAFSEKYNQYCSIDVELNNDIERVKPYLFPLSSMTEEQKKELYDKLTELELKSLNDEISRIEVVKFEIEYYLKNHLDYIGLIPMGLAKDAGGLNIY